MFNTNSNQNPRRKNVKNYPISRNIQFSISLYIKKYTRFLLSKCLRIRLPTISTFNAQLMLNSVPTSFMDSSDHRSLQCFQQWELQKRPIFHKGLLNMGRKLVLVGAALHRERPYTEKHQMEGSYMLKVKKMGFQKKLYITQEGTTCKKNIRQSETKVTSK